MFTYIVTIFSCSCPFLQSRSLSENNNKKVTTLILYSPISLILYLHYYYIITILYSWYYIRNGIRVRLTAIQRDNSTGFETSWVFDRHSARMEKGALRTVEILNAEHILGSLRSPPCNVSYGTDLQTRHISCKVHSKYTIYVI